MTSCVAVESLRATFAGRFMSVKVANDLCVVDCSSFIAISRQEMSCWPTITSLRSVTLDLQKTSTNTASTTRSPTYDNSFDTSHDHYVCVEK